MADGTFIVPPMSTSIYLEEPESGLYLASSGGHILVVGPPPRDSVAAGWHLYLMDLLGSHLDGPIDLDPDDRDRNGVAAFWEGDAYAALWPKDGGIMYQRFRVE
jgi:hypothetical protein